jgi:hypothetical protein
LTEAFVDSITIASTFSVSVHDGAHVINVWVRLALFASRFEGRQLAKDSVDLVDHPVRAGHI